MGACYTFYYKPGAMPATVTRVILFIPYVNPNRSQQILRIDEEKQGAERLNSQTKERQGA